MGESAVIANIEHPPESASTSKPPEGAVEVIRGRTSNMSKSLLRGIV
jgi:hypothetical protein